MSINWNKKKNPRVQNFNKPARKKKSQHKVMVTAMCSKAAVQLLMGHTFATCMKSILYINNTEYSLPIAGYPR
jgi:hypothetical protein